MSTRLPNRAGADISASDEENRKRHEKALRDIGSPDEVERCNCFCTIPPVQGRHCVVCNHTHAPQPTGGVEEAINELRKYSQSIAFEHGLNKLQALIAAERTKARVEELENWRVFLGADKYVVAEIDERLAKLKHE